MSGPFSVPPTMLAMLRTAPVPWGAPMLISSLAIWHCSRYRKESEGSRIAGPLGKKSFPGEFDWEAILAVSR